MKALALVFALVITTASSAHAILETSGRFTATQCGLQQYYEHAPSFTVDVSQVCIGHIDSPDYEELEAVSFLLTDGTRRVFYVEKKSNPLVAMLSGVKPAVFHLIDDDGQEITMKTIQTKDGSVKSVSGQLDNVPYFVPEFQVVFSTF